MEDTMQTRLTVAIIAFAAAAALARGADGWRTSESARARLHADRIAELERTYRGADGFDAFLAQERESLGEALSSLAGDTAPRRMPGMKLEAYFAENDGSAQPFWTYAPPAEDGAAASGEGAPLLVYLHGYVPYYDIVNTPTIPYMMTSLVARAGAYIAAPFGRSNTDFQGPGEQDVLRVIDEMHARYGIDRDRVLLVGYSMGGMGAWSAGGRFAERFNAMLIMSGRSDYYVWHEVEPAAVPQWQRRIIDTQFGTPWLKRLVDMPILAVHGGLDPLVTVKQGRYPVDELKKLGSENVELLVLPESAHAIAADAFADKRVAEFVEANLERRNAKRPQPLGRIPGFTGSRAQDALLSPFVMVSPSVLTLERRAAEWRRFAKGEAPRMVETADMASATTGAESAPGTESAPDAVKAAKLRDRALLVFGEPEASPLARRVLEEGGVKIAPDSFEFAGRTFPREGRGLWFSGRNPFNPALPAIVQCGAQWGAGASENHLYDRIPDVAVYSVEPESCAGVDTETLNKVVAAGFFADDGTFAWCDDAP